MTENGRKRIEEVNRTDFPIPDCLIQSFFEEQVKIRPDKVAVIYRDTKLTYKELDVRSNQLAWRLLSMNLHSGNNVGIFLERSVEMVISVLAVLKAGACYLPLDPIYPEDRIKYMVGNSDIEILISQDSLNTGFLHLPEHSIIIIDLERGMLNNFTKVKPNLNLTPHSFAYLLYTSGSTGKPKGIRIHHKAVVNFISSMIKFPGMDEDDILLAVTTLSFDISVLELFLSLSVGATIVIADTSDTTDGSSLINLIEKHKITFLQATPSLWNFLIACGWNGNRNLIAISGGEALPHNLLQQVFPKVRELWNFYGPTETTVWSTGMKITDPDAPVLIGKPIDNTKIYILDNEYKQLPVGAIGEICIGGLGVAKGYFTNAEITAQKFISFGEGNTIYRTGDLGRYHEDGNIEFIGRIDNQIKLNGFRIEPGEIEGVLGRLRGIREAVVKLHKFNENDERLVAFLNVENEPTLSNKEIIDKLELKLPNYMVPKFYKKVYGFPRMPNGKIKRNALFFDTSIDYMREEELEIDGFSQTEKIIYSIWCEALKTKNFLKTDDFFSIGGNSILALSVVSKITFVFNTKLSLRFFFDNPRIVDLAEVIDNQEQSLVQKKL
jgi:amino acid adenylation domain-containing protein